MGTPTWGHHNKSAIANMSDNEEIEVEAVSGYQVLPKEVTAEIGTIKLFNKWSYEDVEIRDISLTDYIQIRASLHLPFRRSICPEEIQKGTVPNHRASLQLLDDGRSQQRKEA